VTIVVTKNVQLKFWVIILMTSGHQMWDGKSTFFTVFFTVPAVWIPRSLIPPSRIPSFALSFLPFPSFLFFPPLPAALLNPATGLGYSKYQDFFSHAGLDIVILRLSRLCHFKGYYKTQTATGNRLSKCNSSRVGTVTGSLG